tara:strand:+ start:296 stop:751 length:456 start_codon:yes stop_codon:yes gene_type:complete
MKKVFITIFILLVLSNCGYSPIYIKNEMANFNVDVNEISGDRLINNLISSQLNRSKDKLSKNKITLKINTEYKKIINSKDATGAAASYELSVITKINVSNKSNNKTFQFSERFIMDKNENLLDEKNYERTVKQSFASSIADKIILELNSFK